jgi:hypothetical protein
MNKPATIISTLLVLYSNFLFPQARQYSFIIQILLDNNATRTAPYIEMLFDGNRQKANQDGMISYTVSTSNQEVILSMPDQREYLIVGSPIVPLPANAEKSITIVVRKPTQKEQAVDQVEKELKQLNFKIDKLDSIKKNDNEQYQRMLAVQDSVFRSVTQKFQVSESDLRSATEKMRGRDKYFAEISSSLEKYLNEAKDIKDIFKNMLAFSLENPASFRLFDSTINVYNKAYNNLNDNNNEYEKAITDFWDSEELALGFHSVFDFAINDTHRAGILPLNTLLNEKVNEYIHESNKSKQKELKKEIIATLNGVIPFLENNLSILESKTSYYINKLESQKNIYAP